MGIDKPDVRLVCLVNYPDSLEGYVQMVGRAGRDREPSQTLLLASPSDATAFDGSRSSDVPTPASCVPSTARCATPTGSSSLTISPRSCRNAMRAFSSGCSSRPVSFAASFDEGRLMRIEVPAAPEDARERVEALLDRAATRRRVARRPRVGFAETRVCRHEQVAAHFGERLRRPVRRLRRVRPVDPWCGIDLEPAAAAAR